MLLAVPRPPVSPVRVHLVGTVQDQLEVPREARPAAQAMVDTVLVDQPSLVREDLEDTVLEVDQPRVVRLAAQAMDMAVDLVRPREARPAVQVMVDTVDILVIPREVRDQVRAMVDTVQEVTRRVPREAEEEDTDQEVIRSPRREAEEDTEVDQER